MPSILLLVFNFLIIYKQDIVSRKRFRKNGIKHPLITKTLLFLTLWYIFATVPHAIVGGFFFDSFYFNKNGGRSFLYCIQSMTFLYHSSNFFVLYIFNKQFKHEANLFLEKLRNRIFHICKRTKENSTKMYTRKNKIIITWV